MLKLVAGLTCCKPRQKPTVNLRGETDDDEWEDDSDEGPDDQIQKPARYSSVKDAAMFEEYPVDDVKMVLVVRTDLKMGSGKMAAQCGHATIGTF